MLEELEKGVIENTFQLPNIEMLRSALSETYIKVFGMLTILAGAALERKSISKEEWNKLNA